MSSDFPLSMAAFEAEYKSIAATPKGPIVGVIFRGTYPPGSAGNEFAQEMISFLRSVFTDENPAAVMFDLTALDYVSGDAIAGLALPLRDDGIGFRLAAIVATGQTACAIKPLIEPRWMLGLAGMKLFDARREAIAYLERAILGRS